MTALATYRDHARGLLALGLPIVGSNLAFTAIGLTDTVMLGWYSVEALAAEVLANSFFFIIFLVGSGFAWAVMPMVAAHAEAGEITELRRVTRMGLWASVAFGIVVLPVLLSGTWLFTLIGQEPELVPLADAYLDIVAWAIFPSLLVMVLRSYLSALERTAVLMWANIGAALINAGLNWVLIFGNLGAPELGVRGAAIATLAMYTALLIAMMIYVRIVEPKHKLFQRLWRIDRGALWRVVTLGWPIGLTTFAEVGLFAGSAVFMGWLGTIPLAAHGIALQLASVVFVLHLGISNAATVRAGRAQSRGDFEGLRAGSAAAVGLSLAMSVVTITAFVTVPGALAGMFVNPTDPARDQILEVAKMLLLLAAAFQTFDGLQVIALGLLRGLQDTRVPMIHATVSYLVIGVPACLVLGFALNLGAAGVWSGLVIALFCASVLLMGRFWSKVRIPAAA